MKVSKVMLLISFALGACETVESLLPIQAPSQGTLSTFTIPAGEHSSTDDLQIFDSNSLRFQVRFDSSAIYHTKNPENQADINKLYGFSDCGTHHHENSARIGWRWYQNQLELHAYAYVAGERKTAFIKAIRLEKEANCEISITDGKFVFTVDDSQVSIARSCTLDPGGYRLYPYFGGDETAPHTIQIEIQEK